MDIGIREEVIKALSQIKTEEDCAAFFLKYLSKSGEITKLMASLRDVNPTERASVGAMYNTFKRDTEEKFFKLQNKIKEQAQREKMMSDPLIDITIPKLGAVATGGLHPITIITREVEEVFAGMGFIIEEGPEIATEYQNFESVNIPKNHPARDMQDTFWLSDGRVLRTHTSMWQNQMMKKYGPTFRAICPGRCFRNENLDATHDTTFFQVEGMMVGEDISISNLIYFMKKVLSAVFKKDINVRLRPSYYPFVEPGFDLDASCIFCGGVGCPICKHTGWVEFCGCGMIHPNVLKEGGIDHTKYQGFAFGFGLTRLAMMRWGIKDIRLFNSGNLEFLNGSTVSVMEMPIKSSNAITPVKFPFGTKGCRASDGVGDIYDKETPTPSLTAFVPPLRPEGELPLNRHFQDGQGGTK